jgi:hypothetical protein
MAATGEGGGDGVKKGFLHEVKVEAPKDADRFVLEEAQGLLEKVEDLNAEDCEETNPFRAKYQAREMLQKLLKQLAACEGRGTTSSFEEVRVATSLRAEYLLGVNFYDCEETSSGEKTLVGAVSRMRASPTFSRVALMDALNHLGMIWCRPDRSVCSCQNLALPYSGRLIFFKLSPSVCGTNTSSLVRERAPAHQIYLTKMYL